MGPTLKLAGPPRTEPETLHVAALVFDLGDVLCDATVWRRWLLQLLSHMGLHTQYEAFFRLWEREHLYEVFRGRRDFWAALRSMLNEVGLSRSQIDEVFAAARPRRTLMERSHRPLPGVAATLAQLAASGWPMAVLENADCPSEQIDALLRGLGLANYFQAALSSRDLDAAKPDKASYLAAAERLGVPAHEAAFVGHDEMELRGAAEVGMATIAVHHGPLAEADVLLPRFDQLLQRVRRREPSRQAA